MAMVALPAIFNIFLLKRSEHWLRCFDGQYLKVSPFQPKNIFRQIIIFTTRKQNGRQRRFCLRCHSVITWTYLKRTHHHSKRHCARGSSKKLALIREEHRRRDSVKQRIRTLVEQVIREKTLRAASLKRHFPYDRTSIHFAGSSHSYTEGFPTMDQYSIRHVFRLGSATETAAEQIARHTFQSDASIIRRYVQDGVKKDGVLAK